MMQPTLTESLAAYWSRVSFDEIPAETIRTTKRFLLDTLAAGIAGASTKVTQSVIDACGQWLEGGPAGSGAVWGREVRLPAPQAALVNGTSAHALELDDFGGCGHSGAVVIPAACALSGRGGVSGRDLLVAILAGYDLAARVLEGAAGYRPHNALGWHSTGTCGSFGAAAAAARLMKLDAAKFADALGIAGTFTGGIWAFLADGADTKRFHPGKASETGAAAAFLARSGMSGPRQILEAEWGGFFGTYTPGIATPELTLEKLGEEFRIVRSGMKPYACCRGLHFTIDALFELMAEMGAPSEAIAKMVVHGNAQTVRQFGRQDIATLLDAQFSMPYALAVAAESGRATIDQFSPLRTGEANIKRLMTVTEIVPDRVLKDGDYPALELHLKDGRSRERSIAFAKGAPENPLTDDELALKVETLVAPVLGSERHKRIVEAVDRLDKMADAAELMDLLGNPESPARAA
ncbi:MAG TPA: MmgE/PrpD family protein [Rhizobiaceae bacterium]|nr:MmgE/PrpD family protein [Rhizobiaceae bacterium]